MRYAAKVENGVVTNVIVGDSRWAESRLGGMWVGSDTLVGIGWVQFDDGLRPPAPFPSWTWDGSKWKAPKRKPLLGGPYVWDEAELEWVSADDVL